MTTYQNEDLGSDTASVADEVMTQLEEVVAKARDRYNQTVELHRGKAVAYDTAFESLRSIEDMANWATRMLIEIIGRERKLNGNTRETPSMRRMAEVSGVSLASIHAWVNHPAKVLPNGETGPGTLPKPGKTSHYHNSGPGYFTEGDGDPSANSEDF